MRLGLVGRVAVIGLGACLTAACEPEHETDSAVGSAPTTRKAPPASTRATATGAPARSAGGQDGETSIAVRSITDGDTLVVADGRRVRLAQVDAPETYECFGTESTRALSHLVAGKSVVLRRTSGPAKDRYGRTLAEVLVDGKSANEALVRDGAAEWYEQFGHEDPELADRLHSAEAMARQSGRGLWPACRAQGPSSPAPLYAPAVSPSTSRPASPTSGNCHPAYPDECIPPPPPDLDCPSIGHQVRVDHAYGDPHRLDADSDGIGCESYG